MGGSGSGKSLTALTYLGQIVEVAPRDELFTNPRHPCARMLAASLAEDERTGEHELVSHLKGEPPSPVDPPTGCRFRPRCSLAQDICATTAPAVAGHGEQQLVTWHFWDQ